MAQFQAQNSITIKRTRTNDNLTLTFENNGKPLYQYIDPEPATAVITPDWDKTDSNRPVITPRITSLQGAAVTIQSPQWRYNGQLINFNGATSGSYTLSSDGKFGLNPTTGAIKIFKNLASTINIANDTLSFECQAVVAGVEYPMNGDVTIFIQRSGTNVYFLSIDASTGVILDNTNVSTTLNLTLFYGGESQTLPGDYQIKWYKGSTEWVDEANMSSVAVTRDDVNGAQLIVAKVFSNGDVVAAAGINIRDNADEYTVVPAITSTNKTVAPDQPVTVQFSVVNMTTGAMAKSGSTIGISSFNWRLDIYNKTTWEKLQTTQTSTAVQPTIQITTAHTDRNGVMQDVDVVGEVDITI